MAGGAEQYAEQIIATVSQPIVVLTDELQVEMVNEAFCQSFHVAVRESENRRFYDLGNGQWNIPELRRLLREVLSERAEVRDYRVEHEFEQIGKRIMVLNARRLARAGGGDRIVLAINDITAAERQRFELEGRIEFSEKLIDSIRESLLILDWDLRVQFANQPFYEQFGVKPDETVGRMVYDLGNGQWGIPELREALERILSEASAFDDYQVEHEFYGIGRRIMLLNGRRLDHLNLIILAIRDISEHERRRQAFLEESQHRVKNILSNVSALANQTRRRCDGLDDFFEKFMARLAALARAQELLLKSPEDEVELSEIVRVEMEAIGAEQGRTYTADGPPLMLSPRGAQALTMAVHELATNAGKYGALKTAGGRIRIEWRCDRSEADVHLLWREQGVRIADSEADRGFGSEVIERIVPQLGGTATLELHPDGAECRIAFPVGGRDR